MVRFESSAACSSWILGLLYRHHRLPVRSDCRVVQFRVTANSKFECQVGCSQTDLPIMSGGSAEAVQQEVIVVDASHQQSNSKQLMPMSQSAGQHSSSGAGRAEITARWKGEFTACNMSTV